MRLRTPSYVALAVCLAVGSCGESTDSDALNTPGSTGENDAGIGRNDPDGSALREPDGRVVQCATDEKASPPVQPILEPFTFQVIGDVHAHADLGSNANIVSAMADLRSTGGNVSALIINGDLTEHGYQSEYNGLNQALSGGTPHRLHNMGNHDYHGADSSATELQRYLNFASLPSVYWEYAINGYPFLFLAGENGDAASWIAGGNTLAWYAVLSDAQLDWLDQRLTALASPTRPSFVFLHQGTWDTTNPARLEQILGAHPNVLFFWSHYHRDLHSVPVDPALFTTSRAFRQIHTGAVQYCWDNATPNNRHNEWYQGVQVSVYPDRVQIRGRDFAAHAWISQFEFQLDQRPPSALGSALANKDGRLELMVAGSDGKAKRNVQGSPGAGWSGWTDQGTALASAPVIAKNLDGRLEAFARGSDSALWHSSQSAPGGTWSPWTSLGGAHTSNIAVGQNKDGTLEVFARGVDDALWHNWQMKPGDAAWAGWQSFGGIITSDVGVARLEDGRLDAFVHGIDNGLVHITQDAPMGTWGTWAGFPDGPLISKIAIGQNADGRLEVFGLGLKNELVHIVQQAGGGWSNWATLGGSFTSNPVVIKNLDGRLEVFLRGGDNALFHISQKTAGGMDWSDWSKLGGTITADPIVGQDADGRLEVFARWTDNTLYSIRQQTVGKCWSSWSSVGSPVMAF